jgi:hypothetical protein
LAKDLKSDDPKTREEAKRKLEELKKLAQDPSARKAAEEALKQQQDQSAKKSSEDKGQSPDQKKSGEEAKKSEGDKTAGNDRSKPDEKSAKGNDKQKQNQKKGQESANKSDGSTEDNDGQKTRGKPGSTSTAKDTKVPPGSGAGSKSGSEPSREERAGANTGERQSGETRAEPGEDAQAKYQKKAGDLQLDDIRKRVNADVLKRANMTEAEFQEFLKAKEAMLKKSPPPPSGKDDLIAPQQGNRGLPNQKVRRVESTSTKPADKSDSIGPLEAPPEFREAYREFTRQMNEGRRANDQK